MWVLMPVALWGCKQPLVAEPRPPGILLVADTGNGRALVVDHEADHIVGEVCTRVSLPEQCPAAEGSVEPGCLLFGTELRGHSTTELRVELVYGLMDESMAGFRGGAAEVALTADGPSLVWNLYDLEWPEGSNASIACGVKPDLKSCRADMPHEAEWMPDGSALVVADTGNDRILIVDPPGLDGATPVRAVIDGLTPGVRPQRWPNGVELFEEAGVVYLLVSYKGSSAGEPGQDNEGGILLWDVTDVGAPSLVWRYPEKGALAAVHHALLSQQQDAWVLQYAHSLGASDDLAIGETGSLGFAQMRLDGPPIYWADVVIERDEEAGIPAFGFVREAELIAQGEELLVTDSGCENRLADCGRTGRVIELAVDWPSPREAGLSGAWTPGGTEQRFLTWEVLREGYTGGIDYPFEADLLDLDALGGFPADDVPGCAP